MPVTTIVDLVQELSLGALLTPLQRQELVVLQTSFTDLRLLARELVKLGWLTPYQVNQVVQGRTRELLLGPYVLLERLGEGGMGQVFKARHTFLNRPVALKLIGQEHLKNRGAAERFLKEMQLVAQLDHPHIVRALDAGQADQRYYLAMELIDGPTLSRLVQQRGPLAVPQACACIYQAALGLQHASERGLVHRDIKPSNLMLATPAGGSPQVKILDLGLARLQGSDPERDLTRTGTTMGTLDYLAPEQALDPRKVDVRADLYSLGCTFYFLLAGRPPFDGATEAQKLLQHQQQEPPPLERADVSPEVNEVLRRLLAKQPDQRYATPAALATALQPFAAGAGDVRATGISPMLGADPASLAERPAALPEGGFSLLSEKTRLSTGAEPPRSGSKTNVEPSLIEQKAANPERGFTLLSEAGTPARPLDTRRSPLQIAADVLAVLLLLTGLWLLSGMVGEPTKGTSTETPRQPETPTSKLFARGPLRYLSDLPEFEWMSGPSHLFKNGKLNRDSSIKVNGVGSPHGISLTPPRDIFASITYQLHREAAVFKAKVALDDSSKPRGEAEFEVHGDGRSLWRSSRIGKTQMIEECKVSVAGVKFLELRVTPNGIFSSGLLAVWLEPRVLQHADTPDQ